MVDLVQVHLYLCTLVCVLNDFKESPVLYGGDCIIARMYFFKKKDAIL